MCGVRIERIAGRAEFAEALVVGEDDDDVGLGRRFRGVDG